MSDYAGLESVMDQIIDEAIEWAMSDGYWYPSGDGFRLTGPYAWTVPGPGAGPTGPIEFLEPRSGATLTFDFWTSCYSPITERVRAMFQPYLDMPKPEQFASSIRLSTEGTHKIATGEEIDGTPVEPNPQLAAIKSAGDDLSNMSGRTIEAFRFRYLDRMPIVLKAQAGSAATLTELVAAEAAVWGNVQASAASTADAALTAMKAHGSSNAAALLSVAGVVLSVAGAVASGGLSLALTAAGAVAGAAPDFMGDEKPVPLSGGSADDVLSSVEGALKELDQDIVSEEEQVAEKARSAVQALGGEGYDLSIPPRFFDGHSEEGYTWRGEMIALQAHKLRNVAQEHLPRIARQLRASSQALSSADDYSAWSRSTLGLGSSGAYYDWLALRDGIVDFLLANEKACHDAADQLLIAAKFHGDTDDAVSTDLQRHAAEVAEENTPAPPPPHLLAPGMRPF